MVEALRNATSVQVEAYWPGPETEGEGIYVGDWDAGTAGSGQMAPRSIKTGRQHREEIAESAWTIQDWRTAETLADLPAAKERVWELFGVIEDVIADDPTVDGTVAFFESYRYSMRQVQTGRGWALRMSLFITFHARLT